MKGSLINRIYQFLRTRPAKVVLAYMVGAALWITTSSSLLPQTVTNPELQGIFETLKGLLFVLVTGTLLYVTLRNWVPEESAQHEQYAYTSKPWSKIHVLPASFTLFIFLPLLIFLIYLVNAPALEREAQSRLLGKAKVQAIHIESWLNERNSDAEVLYHNRTLSEVTSHLQRTGDKNSRELVAEYLQEVQKNYNYESIILLDREGNPLLSLGEHAILSAATVALINEARNDGEIKHNHHFMLDGDHIHTDYIVPLFSSPRKESTPTTFIMMRSNLNTVLTLTGQIAQNDAKKDDVLLLTINADTLLAFDTTTGKRHHSRKISQLQDYYPAVIASRGKPTGTIITTDFRDVTVLAAWQRINGTKWNILAKADRNTVLAPLWNILGWVALVGTFLIAVIIALLHMLWKRQEYYQQLERLAREKQTDQLLNHFFEMPLVGMAIWSAKNGGWVRFNDHLCEMLGYTRSRMNKLYWKELSHPGDSAAEEQALEEINEGKIDSYSMEKRLLRIDGTVLYSDVDVHCVRDDTGKADLLVATVNDITAYKHTIEALRESEARFQNIFNGVLDGIALADKDTGAFIAGNTAFCKMLGYTREEIEGMSFHDIHPEETLVAIEEAYAHATVDKVEIIEDVKVLRKDGSIFSADIKGGLIMVGDREYIMGIFRDTSERNTMLQALADNESRLSTLINTIPDLIWLKDTSGVYLLCNATFEEFIGAPMSEIVGKTDYDFFDQELGNFFQENDLKAMQAGKPRMNEETVTFANNGQEVVLETIKAPVQDGQGKLVGILGIGRDITARKNYENKLERLSQFYAALSQSNEAIIRCADETELLQDICRIAVQLTQIKAAWVGMIDKNGETLQWAAGYGEGNEELATITTAAENRTNMGNSPCYQAFKHNKDIWIQNYPGDELGEPCRKIATAHHWRSAASLPLHREGAVIGVLNLYAGIENAFDEDVRKLLNEMAFDISFALDNFVLENQRRASEKSLLESEQRFRGLVEQSLSGIYIIQNDKYVYANPRFAEILGFTSEAELVGTTPVELIVEEDRAEVSNQLNSLLSGKRTHIAYEVQVQRRDGKLIDIGVHGALATYLGHPAIIGLIQDVTDKKQSEEHLKIYVEKLQASLMQTVEVATLLSEMRDPYTAGHERRVAEVAAAIGKEMGLNEHQQEGLRVAGHLHDIGKINIPSEILAKPGKLTTLEYEIIKGHPEAGFNVLKDVDFPWPVAQVALQHHERIDGSGYPAGLKGEHILLEARITAVADVVEAMGSHRPYRPGLGIGPALEEIERGKGTLYDLNVAEACLRLFREKGYSLPA